MGNPIYTPAYFIEKFRAVPDGKWADPMEHLGVKNLYALKPEAQALADLFREAGFWMMELNHEPNSKFQQDTPKARIIAALELIAQKNQSDEP
jgi:N-acetylglutamate synthase-like GNAT family acetyltransferase